jgi:hypothetical protein
MDQVASFAATGRLVLASWVRGSVPRHYAVDALHDLDRSLASASDKIRKAKDLPATMRERSLAVISELQSNLALGASNVRDGGHVAAAGSLPRLRAIQERAQALARAAGSER